MAEPIGAYFICATPRSGTTLLCDLLKQTGVAGQPDSFYRAESIGDFVQRFGIAPGEGLAFERRYLAAVIEVGTAGTGMFGMRIMWPTMPELMEKLSMLFPDAVDDAARLAAAFGPARYVFVEREDKVAQAISRIKAEQSGLWHRAADGRAREAVKPYEAPVYDAAALKASAAETTGHEANWAAWFAAQGVGPLTVTYEELATDPRGTVARVLAALGRDPAMASRIEARTARLADGQSREWAERFAREG